MFHNKGPQGIRCDLPISDTCHQNFFIFQIRQQLLQLAQVVDEARGTRLAPALAAEYAGSSPASAVAGTAPQPKNVSAMERSRKQSREAVQPR